MPYSLTEKKRVRRSFSSVSAAIDIPPLMELQKSSYRKFLQQDTPHEARGAWGLQRAYQTVFPIVSTSGGVRLEFERYRIDPPVYDIRECKERGLTYEAKVYADINLVILEKNGEVREAKGETVYMGELPTMTETGSFIINGTERVIVSQLHRSPGIFFEHDSGRTMLSGKYLYSARVIPYSGCWLDFEFDQKDILYFRLDRRRKMPVTLLLKALGYGDEEILREFHKADHVTLNDAADKATMRLNPQLLVNAVLPFDIKDKKGKVVVRAEARVKKADARRIQKKIDDGEMDADHPVPDSFLIGRRLRRAAMSPDGEVVLRANAELTEADFAAPVEKEAEKKKERKTKTKKEKAEKARFQSLRAAGVRELELVHTNELDCKPFIPATLALNNETQMKMSRDACRADIYKVMRPGDPPNPEVINGYFEGLMFNKDRYSLSEVGRMKLNRRLDRSRPEMEYRVVLTALPKDREGEAKIAAALAKEKCVSAEQWADFAEMFRLCNELPRAVRENMTKPDAESLYERLRAAGVPCELQQQTTLSREDILAVVKMLADLGNGRERADDVDSLANRRVRAVGEFVENAYRVGLERVQRAIRDRLSRADTEQLMPHDLISAKAITASVAEFFSGSHLSQFMDQTNALSEITHKRRVSALGAGGLTRERAGFEVRDVHRTHYGRLCPIETPEGPNIGLINSMALYAGVNDYGFLQTPYRRVKDGRVTKEIAHLSAIEEGGAVIAQANTQVDKQGRLLGDQLDGKVAVRRDGEFDIATPDEVDYLDVAPAQIASVAASLVPFLEHDDANRALMGSNMQRQAVPCLRPEKPLVGTGVEQRVAVDSHSVIRAQRDGVVDYVDGGRIVLRAQSDDSDKDGGSAPGVDIYNLIKHTRSNQNTSLHQRPLVREGEAVRAGDIIADGAATDMGELALGQNALVAFMPWNGFNFEDSILVSEKMVADERFSSIHIIEEVAEARETKLGNEEITRDIPNQSDAALAHLDDSGIVFVGTRVRPGDVLVGRVTPKGERQYTPEEKLLLAVFGDRASEVKDTSLRMPPGAEGTVIDVKVFTAEEDVAKWDKRTKSIIDEEMNLFRKDQTDTMRVLEEDGAARMRRIALGKTLAATAGAMQKGEKVTAAGFDALKPGEALKIRLAEESAAAAAKRINEGLEQQRKAQKEAKRIKEDKMYKHHDLKPGVLKVVKVYIAIKRPLQVGDKMAGRHGNKGVVSKIVPVEDMPYLEDGTPVDIVLNPLGVPSRMNVGQVLETHLGLAAGALGRKVEAMLAEKKVDIKALRAFLDKVYNGDGRRRLDWAEYQNDEEVLELARNLARGVPFATPIFDGAPEEQIHRMLELGGCPTSGQLTLRDGRSGEKFSRPVTVGHMYVMKLHHLVDEKMHARSTGPYSLITQQPLGGKARMGGQRFGEMEVWALEAYGAAYTLCEMLTVKSDDINGRLKVYESIVDGEFKLDSGVPESFNVLIKEIRALGLDADFK